jgi:hypothetical protein
MLLQITQKGHRKSLPEPKPKPHSVVFYCCQRKLQIQACVHGKAASEDWKFVFRPSHNFHLASQLDSEISFPE